MNKEYCDSCGKENKVSLWSGEDLEVLTYDMWDTNLSARVCKECSKKIFKIARAFTDKEMRVKK